jgi:phosphoglycerate dehydrogenase-like enzyme
MSKLPDLFIAIRPSLYAKLFSAQSDAILRAVTRVHAHDAENDLTRDRLVSRLGDLDAIITGWGTPSLDESAVRAAGRLKLIAHSAGSIKHLLPAAVWERGIAVTHAAGAIAPAVAETSLLMTMLMLRPIHKLDAAMRAGEGWDQARAMGGDEIAGARIGVIGAGYTGRRFIQLLKAVDADVWVYDPYLSDAVASEMGVRKVGLNDLMRGCPVVSIQAPSTKETHHMIGRQELALMQDGAVLVNTARSALVDEAALLAELESGRIRAALDVFDNEPLPAQNPFRKLPNVLMTPHIAGITPQASLRQGQTIAEEVRRFFAGQPLKYPVTARMLETMA